MLYAYRSVVFNGELRDENGMEIISRLILLSAEDSHSDIHLWINSPGGSVPMMHAIADVIETLPNDVVTVAFGWAASAGQFVLMMGTPGKRLALPHARILLHQGSSGIGERPLTSSCSPGTCAPSGTRSCIASPRRRERPMSASSRTPCAIGGSRSNRHWTTGSSTASSSPRPICAAGSVRHEPVHDSECR